MVRESLHRPSMTDEDSELETNQLSASPSLHAVELLEPVSTSFESGVASSVLLERYNNDDRLNLKEDMMNSSIRRPSLDEEIQSTINELKCNSLSMKKCPSSPARDNVTPSDASCHGSNSSDTTSISTLTIRQVPSLFLKQDAKGKLHGSLSVKPSTSSLPSIAVPIATSVSKFRTSSLASSRRLGPAYQIYSPAQTSQSLSKSLNGRKGLIGADEEESLVNRAVQEEKFSGRMKSEEMAVLQMLDQMSCSTDSSQRSHQPLSSTLAAFPRPKPARSTPKKVISTFTMPESPSRMSVKAVANAVNQGGRQSPFQSPSRKHLTIDSLEVNASQDNSRSGWQGGVKQAVIDREKLDQSCCNSPGSDLRSDIKSTNDPISESYAGIGTYMARFSHRGSSTSPTRLSTSPKRQVFQRQESEASINPSYASQTNAFLNRRPTHAADRRLTHSPKSSLIFSSADESTSSFWSRRKGVLDSPDTDATTPGVSSESDFGSGSKVPRAQQKLLVNQIMETTAVSKVEDVNVSIEQANKAPSTEAHSDEVALKSADTKVKSSESVSQSPAKAAVVPLHTPVKCRTTVVAASSFLSSSQSLPSSLSTNKPTSSQSPSKLSTPTRAKDLIRLYESNNEVDKTPLTPTKMTPSTSLMSPLTNPHVIANHSTLSNVTSPSMGPPVPPKQTSQKADVGMIKVTPRKAVNYSLLSNAASKGTSTGVGSMSAAVSHSTAAPTLQSSPSPSKTSLPYLLPTPNIQGEDRDDFGPPSPPSDLQFSWPTDTDAELLPADSASQRVARTPTMSSRFTAVPHRHALKELRITNAESIKTPAQKLRDDVVSDLKLGGYHEDTALSTVEESVVAENFSTPLTNSYGDQMMGTGVPSSPSEGVTPSVHKEEAIASNTSSQDVALVLQFLEKQQREREQREAFLDAQLRSFQDTLHSMKVTAAKEAPQPIEKEGSSHGSARTSQAIQTPALDDCTSRNADLTTVLQAIKDNERARESQQKQQHEIAHYLNDLNSWLERDVVDRTNEWKTLAMGVTKLHEELNEIKSGQAINTARNVEGVSILPPHPDGAIPTALEAGGPSGPRMMRVDEAHFSASLDLQQQQQQSLQDQMMAVGVEPPAPIVTPGPSSTIKRSGTRTWRAEAAPGAMRNNDVWAGGPVKTKDKKSREEKKAEGRARRRSAFTDSSVGRIALAAGGAALLRAATHEYEKYKERQRSEGKPEDSSSSIDEKTGKYEQHEEVPEAHIVKMKEAIIKGDESKIREAVKGAAEVGAGAAAIHKLMDWIKGGADQDEDETQSNQARRSDAKSDGSQSASRSAKSSAASGDDDDDASKTLRDAVESMSSVGGGGAALALAVEEILKHLLEKKEEEKRLAKEEAEAEAAREAKRKQEEEEKEKKMMAIREQEKRELVETILSKLQQEKARQEQEALQKQHELDPKSAIESLVVAINQQRAMDAAQHANADAAIKQLASEVVRTSTESSGQLVEAVHSAAREMLRQNIESHAEELKTALTKEVSTMFEDVGKIRETKRSLEQEIADLFLIKSKHLSDVTAAPAPSAPQDPTTSEVGARAATPTGAPLFPAISNMFRPPTTMPMSKPLPHPQPPAQWCPPSLQPVQQHGASSHPPLNPHELQMLNQAKFAMPISASMSPPKRDLIGPLSINFGPRRK